MVATEDMIEILEEVHRYVRPREGDIDSDIARIIKKCMPESTQGKLDCISQLALQVVKCTSLSKAASGGYL